MAAFIEESDAFDGALREKTTAPKIPPRRRRAPQPSSDDDAPAEEAPAVKKNAGWGMEDSSDGPKPAQGRRAGGGETTVTEGIGAVDAPAKTDTADDDIMVIPDLEENDEEDLILAVAEPGQVQNTTLPTNLKLDDGTLPPSQVEGIDLSLLYESILPQKQLLEDEDNWDPDTMLNQLKQAMQDEEDKRVDDGEKDGKENPGQS